MKTVIALGLIFYLAASGYAAAGQVQKPCRPNSAGCMRGIASWYGGHFQGRRTASGETFDRQALTAAHPSLPFQTRLVVTNLENGRSVTVRVNDRGPGNGRVIDLSEAAARQIGMRGRGFARIAMRIAPEDGHGKPL
jgi:rare lipoprotein A